MHTKSGDDENVTQVPCEKKVKEVSCEAAETRAGPLSTLLFFWVLPFARSGYRAYCKQSFDKDTLPCIPDSETPERNITLLRDLWAAELAKRGPKASLLRVVMMQMLRRSLVTAVVLMNITALALLANPLFSRVLIRSIQQDEPAWKGGVSVVFISVFTAIALLLQQRAAFIGARAARQSWLALTGLIFEKPARLSSGARSDITEGELITLMSQDAQTLMHMLSFLPMLCTAPLFILVPTVVAPFVIGWPYFVGLLTFLLSSFLGHKISKMTMSSYLAKMAAANKRTMCLNEAFQGIRTVKLNAWESVMEDKVATERKLELKSARSVLVVMNLQMMVSFGLPTMGTVATFLLYAWQQGELDASEIFVTLGLMEFLQLGSMTLPHIFTVYRQTLVSFTRMEKLLRKEDDFARADTRSLPVGSVRCVEADFLWSPKSGSEPGPATLRNVSLEASPGEMIGICGRVGSGKTTWAAGLFSLCPKLKGSVDLSGSTAYVTQSPQILNESLKDNVLFGLPMDRHWYDKVITACCLNEDLAQLSHGDETEIGEKGITISGGQKQRVAIARAAFSRANVLVFDDPLSAMDAHVGRRVFEQVFCGLLAGKTRIFCTNQLQFCSECTRVYMLTDGEVVEAGPFDELMARTPPGPFSVFARSVIGSGDGEGISEKTKDRVSPTPKMLNLQAEESTTGGTSKQKSDAAKQEETLSTSAQKNGSKEKGDKLMQKEVKIQGRAGLKDWMQVANAASSPFLGAFVLFMGVIAPLAQYSVNLMLAYWTDTAQGNSAFDDPLPSVLYICSTVFFAGAIFVNGLSGVTYFFRVSQKLHEAMLFSTIRQTMVWFDTTPVGRVLNRFGADMMFLDLRFGMMFSSMGLMFGKAFVTVIVASVTALPTLVLCFVLVLLVKKIFKYYAPVTIEVSRVQALSLSPLLAAQSGFLGALDSIRCFDRVDIYVRRFHEYQQGFITCAYWQNATERACQCCFGAVIVSTFYACVCAVILFLSVHDTPISKLVTPGTAGLVLAYCSALGYSAPMLLSMAASLEQIMSAVQRVAEYKDLPIEDAHLGSAPEEPPLCWPQHGALRLDKVEMRYQPHLPPALKGVSLEVQPGEKLGIVGRTGSGKSSVILTCFRMVEADGGTLTLDGRPLSSVPLFALRSRLGVIPQDSWLFSGTIRSNLDVYGRHSDEELWEVLRLVTLEHQAKSWELGLEQEVKEKGENLSAGSAQLLCLARVLLKRPQVLFMDEATASVDSETDRIVQETIRRKGVLPEGCSIITVAHRLHTVIDYDRIAVLSHGEVVESGHPTQLLDKKGGFLAELVEDMGEGAGRELRRRAAAACVSEL